MYWIISIHALLAESDGFSYFYIIQITGFLSTLSLRRATYATIITICIAQFLSTLSLRRATARRASRQQPAGISIHALLAESDGRITSNGTKKLNFYPRSPCGERRQSTTGRINGRIDFYPRSPCGERRDQGANNRQGRQISIHALLAESDTLQGTHHFAALKFLSTLSLRRATRTLR